MKRRWFALFLALLLIFGGGWLANETQSNNGNVRLTEVSFKAAPNVVISGLLYVPKAATRSNRAPAVLLAHGFINTREMQSPFAIELARRGFVVLAMDMAGHGYSTGIVGAADFGGPAALQFLRQLDVVDRERIGLEGHSMGSRPIAAAAAKFPDGYRAMALVGSRPRVGEGALPLNNVAIVFGTRDEFSDLIWKIPRGDGIGQSPVLKELFNSPEGVSPGRTYGEISRNNGRRLFLVDATHAQEHFSIATVGAVISWFEETLPRSETSLTPGNQVWIWKEIGTFLSLLGMVVAIIASFEITLGTTWFSSVLIPADPPTERREPLWWFNYLMLMLIPAAAFFPLMNLAQSAGPTRYFPQLVHNQLLVWALATSLTGFAVNRMLRGKSVSPLGAWLKPAIAAACAVTIGYVLLLMVDRLLTTDFRIWIWGFKPLTSVRAYIAAPYFLLWLVHFLITFEMLGNSVAVKGESLFVRTVSFVSVLAGGFFCIILWQYGMMSVTHELATPQWPLLNILAVQLFGVLVLLGFIAAYIYSRTNNHVPCAIICAALVTWHTTGGTANHWAPGFETPILEFAAAR